MIQHLTHSVMTAEQFTYWLQGYLEIGDPKALDTEQVKIIKDHLSLVFNKVTPDYFKTYPGTITQTPQLYCNSDKTSIPFIC